MAIFWVLFRRGTPNQAGAFRVPFGQIHIWLRHRAAYWSLPFWSCQALWNVLLLFSPPKSSFMFFWVKPIVLWMVAKSCITNWMVETVETCWNPINNGMFTTYQAFRWPIHSIPDPLGGWPEGNSPGPSALHPRLGRRVAQYEGCEIRAAWRGESGCLGIAMV